jgi:hypothetical protein
MDIVKLLLRKTAARSRPKVFKGNLEATMRDANGSLDSIIQWGRAAQLDPRQKRAFESIISTFLLTFHDFQQDDYNDSTLTRGSCDHARRTKLYPRCPMMLRERRRAQRTGQPFSRSFEKGESQGGRSPMMVHLSCGTRVRGYFASQILSLTLRHEVSDIIPQDFEVVLKPFSFQANNFIS